MSTAGPLGRALVIPASTIDRLLPPLLETGRIARGWLGAALYPVALSEAVSQQIGQDRGLMVLKVAEGGPAAAAEVIAGDILLTLGGTLMGLIAGGSQIRTLGPSRGFPASGGSCVGARKAVRGGLYAGGNRIRTIGPA